jgi:hypothetical protein
MKMAKLKKMLTHLRKNESGQGALAIVIILLMLGAIILTPLLVFMSTGLKAGGVYESKVQEFYAADAGVEDGLWQIKYDKLSTLFPSYNPYDYNTNYSYLLAPNASAHEMNAKNVTVNITNVWIPSNIPTPNPAVATSIIENGTLIVTGKVISYPGGQRGYEIKISYSWQDDDSNGTRLKIATIGAWLSGGFNYTSGSGNLSSYTSTCVPYCGGQAITWNLNNQTFKLSTGYPLVRTFNFNFTGPANQNPNAVSWITTTGVSAIPYSWDADTEPYRIESTAGSTTDEAYVIKNELRKLGAAISGDYCAVGNTLMAATTDIEYRDRLYKVRSATIQSSNPSAAGYIPPGATMEAAFLYWSGWIDWHYPSSSSGIGKLKYSNDTSPDKHILVNQTAKVDRVSFGIPGNMTNITAGTWQVEPNSGTSGTEDTWSYACFADVTSLVRGFIAAGGVSSNGAGTYNLSHIPKARNTSESQYSFSFYGSGSGTTGYPLGTPASCTSWGCERYQYAYAGWSLIIIYSSPETKGHQLYIYGVQTGDFAFINGLADEKLNITISGFLAPADPTGSHMTCFVGEGDAHYGCSSPCGSSSRPSGGSDYIELNGHRLSDGICSNCNVWNSYSNVLGGTAVNGIDIDDFDMSGWIGSRSTTAVVTVGSDFEIYNVIYIILSFRSEITTGGTISYLIRG